MGEPLRQACQELWALDHNRLIPGKDYRLNLQVGARHFNGCPLMRESYVHGIFAQDPAEGCTLVSRPLSQTKSDRIARAAGIEMRLFTVTGGQAQQKQQ